MNFYSPGITGVVSEAEAKATYGIGFDEIDETIVLMNIFVISHSPQLASLLLAIRQVDCMMLRNADIQVMEYWLSRVENV
jgi:hypothetical protein